MLKEDGEKSTVNIKTKPSGGCTMAWTNTEGEEMIDDTARVDWLLQNISGAEFRRMGIIYAGGCNRTDIDKRILIKSDYHQAVDSALVNWGMITTGDAKADLATLIQMELRACLDPTISAKGTGGKHGKY